MDIITIANNRFKISSRLNEQLYAQSLNFLARVTACDNTNLCFIYIGRTGFIFTEPGAYLIGCLKNIYTYIWGKKLPIFRNFK